MKRLVPGWVPEASTRLAMPIPGATPAAPARRTPHLPVQQAQPVRLRPPLDWTSERLSPIDLVVAVDESGSEYVLDPTGVRRAAALSVVNLLRRRRDARVGVVHWGSTAPEELMLPLTSIDQRRRITESLAIPSDCLGGTNVAAALSSAGVLLRHRRRSATPIVVVLTDGIEEVGRDAAQQIGRIPAGCVHVILVDPANACSTDLEAGWRSLGLGSFTRLDHVRTQSMAWQIAEVIACAAGTSMPPLPNRKPTHTN